MDKVKQEVYEGIKLHLDYKRATLVMPILILHHEILRFMETEKGYTPEQVNKALNALYTDGAITVGKTIRYQYITFPQYIEQVNAKLNK